MKFITLLVVNFVLQNTVSTTNLMQELEVNQIPAIVRCDYNLFEFEETRTIGESLYVDSHRRDKRQTEQLRVAEELNSTFEVEMTGYTGDPKEGSGTGLTATGTKPKAGRTVAVSRDLFETLKGKRIYIEGYGEFTVEDTMHKKYKKRIDLFVKTKKEAFNKIGRQKNIRIHTLE